MRMIYGNDAGGKDNNMTDMTIVSLREEPERLEAFIAFFTSHWGKDVVYRECMTASLDSRNPLPQWFMLMEITWAER